MKCPACDEFLLITDRSGVEIDYCPKCRGVWLDRGELDKIIERSLPNNHGKYMEEKSRYYENDYRDQKHPHYGKKKKDSFLEDLFDF